MKLGVIAGAVGVINGAWATAAGALWTSLFGLTGDHGTGSSALMIALGLLIIISSAATFVGPPQALYAPAAFSLIAFLGIATSGADSGGAFYLSALLAVVSIVLDILGARKKVYVPEEDHPLNLPVFG